MGMPLIVVEPCFRNIGLIPLLHRIPEAEIFEVPTSEDFEVGSTVQLLRREVGTADYFHHWYLSSVPQLLPFSSCYGAEATISLRLLGLVPRHHLRRRQR